MTIEALNSGVKNSIKYLFTDCDGVLTDGKYYSGIEGKQLISFSAKDSLAVHLASMTDLKIVIVSSTTIPDIVRKRANDWGIDFYNPRPFHKLDLIQQIANLEEVAYIGDSMDDIRVFENVKLAFAPADAMEEVKAHADYVLKRRGGEGCLLEVFLGLRYNDEDWTKFRPS